MELVCWLVSWSVGQLVEWFLFTPIYMKIHTTSLCIHLDNFL
jgi:hypothetical protein